MLFSRQKMIFNMMFHKLCTPIVECYNVCCEHTFKEEYTLKGKFFKKLIIVVMIVVFAVLLMTTIDKSALKMARAYYTLTNKPSRSDSQFNIPTGRVNLNSDGTRNINFEVSVDMIESEPDVTEDGNSVADGVDDRQDGDVSTISE